MMKKIILAALCAVSSGAYAATVCSNGTVTALTAGGANDFVKVSFAHKCSANIYADALQNNVAIAVAGGSGKGKNVFGGTSAGGTVSSVGACAATGCTISEPASKTQALLDAAT